MTTIPRICVTTVVDSNFEGYIPLFLYCLFSAYPEYEARVFFTDPINPDIVRLLADVRVLGKFEVDRAECLGYPKEPRMAAGLRFLVFTPERIRRYFDNFNAVYVADADLLLVGEQPPLHEQHVAHCRTLGLPYSNMVRDHTVEMLTGLHFITRDGMLAVAEQTVRYDALVRAGGWACIEQQKCICDEQLLYQIVRDSGIGLPPKCQRNAENDVAQMLPGNSHLVWWRPWHGTNLGYAGVARDHPEAWAELADIDLIRDYVEALDSYSGFPLFRRCFEAMPLRGKQAYRRYLELFGRRFEGYGE